MEWKKRFREILDDCYYSDSCGVEFQLHLLDDNGRPVLQLERYGVKGRKWFLSPHMTKSELVQTVFKAMLTYVEHEFRSGFTYKGRLIFGPHFNVDKLVELCDDPNCEELRSDPSLSSGSAL